jgi:RNA polymerase sigma-70 factor (ECF subfamily)
MALRSGATTRQTVAYSVAPLHFSVPEPKKSCGRREFYAVPVVVRGEWMAESEADPESVRTAIVAALPRIRRFCHAVAGNAADGDDLMQSTVERALSRSGQFEPGTRIDSWMFRIAQNLNIDAARARLRRGTTVPIEDIAERVGEDGRDLVENRSQLAAAQRALQAVPDDQRAAFVLVVVEGLSYREAAEVLAVPVGTIMSRIARARARIESAIGEAPGALQ